MTWRRSAYQWACRDGVVHLFTLVNAAVEALEFNYEDRSVRTGNTSPDAVQTLISNVVCALVYESVQ